MMEAFYKHAVELIDSIEDCLAKRRMLPCLTLLYAGIDVIASLERSSDERTREGFVRWASRYVLHRGILKCSAMDLYAARCGILHTFTADSDLSQRGKARKVLYAWGSANASDLAATSKLMGRNDYVVIHIRELIDAFRDGIADYLDDVATDPKRQQKLQSGVHLWFVEMDQEIVREFLNRQADPS